MSAPIRRIKQSAGRKGSAPKNAGSKMGGGENRVADIKNAVGVYCTGAGQGFAKIKGAVS